MRYRYCMDSVIVIGAGGHSLVCVEVLREMGLDVAGCVSSDGDSIADLAAIGIDMLGTIDDLETLRTTHRCAFVAVGNNSARRALTDHATGLGFELVTAIGTRSTVSPSARIDAGALVMSGSTVNALAHVGAGAIVNTGAIIEHECLIGAFAHIAPGAILAGSVTVGQEAMIGMGSQILAGRTIGQHATVGAGAVVIDDVDDRRTVVGIPANRFIDPMPSAKVEPHVHEAGVQQDVNLDDDKIGPTGPTNVLVVCTGNLNRSPLVEALLRRDLASRGIAASVSSAGIAAPVGSPVDNKLRRVAGELGVGGEIDAHRSTQLTPTMLDEADLVLVMTGDHLDELSRFGAIPTRAIPLRTAAWRSRVIGVTDLEFTGWVERLTTDLGATRGNVLSADDVADPIGGRLRQYRAMGNEVSELVGTLVWHWGGR